MRYLLRLSLVFIIMTLSCSTASADKYSRAWKKVNAYLEKDLPESAAKEINNIWDMAAQDGDGRQMLKSAVYLTSVQQTFQENSITDGIELFKTLLPKLTVQEHQALCHAFLVEGYKCFRDNNLNLLRHNRETDDPDAPINMWTIKMITDTICYHLNQSINLAGDVAAGYYEEFFPGGNKAGLKLRPDLVDMLMDNAVIPMNREPLTKSKRAFLNDIRLYGTPLEFLAATRDIGPEDPDLWELYVLNRLTQHNMLSKPSIQTTIDLRRMGVLMTMLENNFDYWNDTFATFVKGCTDLAQLYEKKVKFSTMFYPMAASLIDSHIGEFDFDPERQVSLRRMEHDICVAARKKWPKSEGAIECLKIQYRMEAQSVKLDRDKDLTVGEHNIAMLSYSNINRVYFKVVEVTGRISGISESDLITHLNGITPVVEWSMSLTGQNDWLEHYALVDIPPVLQGNYYLMASTGQYFGKDDYISYEYLECNNIGLAHMTAQNGALSGYTINLKTGKPLSCRYTVWQTNYRDEQVKVATQGFSADDGFVTIDGLPSGYYRIEMEQGQNRGNTTFNVPYVSDMPDRTMVRLFTDRYTYLPGDSVQFTGVVYFSDGYERGHVKSGVELKVAFRDVNYKEVEQLRLTTDSMGVVRGSFHIPESLLPGRASIRVTDAGDDFSYGKDINIESFRQPKFDVVLDELTKEPKFDTQLQITGRVRSFTDVPVDGAQVIWTAGVSSYSVHPLRPRDESETVRIGSGQFTTHADGSFSIPVTVPSEILTESECDVTVRVTVTDVNGETHDRNLTFNVGRQNEVYADATLFFDESGVGIDAQLELDHGNPIDGTMHLKVTKVFPEAAKLPLPFNVRGNRRILELTKIVDDQKLRDRFTRYDFDFKHEYDDFDIVYDQDVQVTAQDGAHVKIHGLKSGIYNVEATSLGTDDSDGVTIIVVPQDDNTFVPENKLLWLYKTDQKVMVGDTVQFKVSSCLPDAVLYWFIESRFGMYDHGYINLGGKQQTLSIPVTEELKGSFALNVGLAYQGHTEHLYRVIEVDDPSKQLEIELLTFRDMLEPDTPQEWTIRVTDHQGNPVQAAILADMYDSALDGYGSNVWMFMPWNSVYVGGSPLFNFYQRYSQQYLYRNLNMVGLEYKGKKAITGTLINPFRYFGGGIYDLIRKLPGVKISTNGQISVHGKSVNRILINGKNFSDDGEEETVLNLSHDIMARVAAYESPSNMARQTGIDDGEEETVLDLAWDDQSQTVSIVALRTDMNPAALFEYLLTDSMGMATLKFNAPQLLTSWNLQAIAFTDSLKTGRISRTVITRKQLMVEPSAPRFLRQGDRMEFTVKVSNLTDADVKAKVALAFTDAQTGKEIKIISGATSKTVTIPANGNVGTSFTVNVPQGLNAVTYRLTAQTTGHSDGIQETIPVLSNRTQVVQSLSLFNNGNEKREFHFDELDRQRPATMDQEQLILEYSATPIWYAIQALPSLIRIDDPSNLRLMHSFMGAAISENLNSRYPAIRRMLDEWAQLPSSQWQTQLERNQRLAGTLLDETPWLRSNQSETDRLRSLATSLGSKETAQAMRDALQKLIDAQASDGGWPWIEGLSSSVQITDEILQGLGLLIENGVVETTPELKNTIQRGLDYLDAYFSKIYIDSKPETLSYSELSYLLTRSYFESFKFSGLTRPAYNYFVNLAQKQETYDLGLRFRASLALLMSRQGKSKRSQEITATLLERSLYHDEMGRWWRDNQGGLLRHEAPIETQALIIRLLLATDHKEEATQAARWLLKQRQTTGWCSSPATAAAVTALMATGADIHLESDPDITIYVGKDVVRASDNKATAGYTIQTWNGPISRDKADIIIDSKTPGISWGGIFRTFTQEIDEVEASENGITLKRTVWRVVQDNVGERLEEVKPGTVLRVGDKLRIQFQITTDRNLEYVQLADMRAATMEPQSTRAGYIYSRQSDIGFYTAPGNTRNVFYIDRMSKGSYVMEYDVKVQKPGHFQEGIAVIQCLYAPEFRATTGGTMLTVE